ncbi:MAG: hypothetical protein IT173_07905 [Acidobacteria bacterium]|nr:hypothetical protein [Acidobacteriota bacterium]
MNSKLKKEWVLTQDAFDRVLLLLDPDREVSGHKYELLRLKLVKYFEWQHLSPPEDLADETVNRLARKLAENGEIENLNAYLLGIARHIVFEDRRQRARFQRAADQLFVKGSTADVRSEGDARLEACNECLAELPERDRGLVLRYYSPAKAGKIEDHKRIAAELGISLNSMRIRVHRIKLRLERCIREREGQKDKS